MNRGTRRPCALLLTVFGAACAVETPLAETPSEACPVIAPQPAGTYPSISYVSYVVDGEIVVANQRHLHRGPHHSVPVDTLVPHPLDNLNLALVESIELFKPPRSEDLGVCPGVAAVSISLRN